jgi:hypothetical protein
MILMALLLTAACAAPTPVTPSPGPWRFSGTVSASDGTHVGDPIAGAALTIVDGVNTSAAVTTDSSGHFAFTDLEPGRFTVAIAADGFASATPVVELHRDTEANFALKPW